MRMLNYNLLQNINIVNAIALRMSNLRQILQEIDAVQAELKELERSHQEEESAVKYLRSVLQKEEQEIGSVQKQLEQSRKELEQQEEREKYLEEAISNARGSNSVLSDMEYQARSDLEAKRRETQQMQVRQRCFRIHQTIWGWNLVFQSDPHI